MKPRLGCVPFLNAKPLIAWFSAGDEAEAEVVFEDPSLLGPMVDRGEVDAAIASSFFAVQDPTLKIAAGVSISSTGPVRSVRLFSRVPFAEIKTLALDSASMTSNHLAQIILAEQFGTRTSCETRQANLTDMLNDCDAAVLIGDAGMQADGSGLHVLDLGEAWKLMTGEPFVWAFWVGRNGLTDQLAAKLLRAKEFGKQEVSSIAESAAAEIGIAYATALEYLTTAIDFDLTTAHLSGFKRYAQYCQAMGFVQSFTMPKLVGEASATAGAS
ncbi:MAG: menaquinone biosynthesis protein [Fimbriimonadales bacterium]